MIRIDGYFDDWEGYEKGIVTYYSDNTLCENHALLLRDDEYLYLYVDMNNLYRAQIPMDAYYLNVAGKQMQFMLKYPKPNGHIDWSKPVYGLRNGIHDGLGVFTYYPDYSFGDAAVEIADSNPYNDRLELRIKIEDVEELMGLEKGTITSGTKVQVTMPNVGRGNIFLEGSATGIALGLVIVLTIAITAARKRLLNKRKKAGLAGDKQ